MTRTVRVAAVAVVVLGLLLALGLALSRTERRYAGSNSVRPDAPVTELRAGDRACQPGQIVPADAAGVEVVAATAGRPGPPLVAELRGPGGGVLVAGRVPGGYVDGRLAIPVAPVAATIPRASVCVRNAGRGRVTLAGNPTSEGGLRHNGRPVPGYLRIAYPRPGEESVLALAPTLAHRFGVARTTLAGGWTLWALIALAACSSALALRLVLARDFGEEPR